MRITLPEPLSRQILTISRNRGQTPTELIYDLVQQYVAASTGSADLPRPQRIEQPCVEEGSDDRADNRTRDSFWFTNQPVNDES